MESRIRGDHDCVGEGHRKTCVQCHSVAVQAYIRHYRQTQGRGFDQVIREDRSDSGRLFSGSKLKWILDHVEGQRGQKRRTALWNCGYLADLESDQQKVHVTDYTNASRTMMYDIHRLRWDEEILEKAGHSGTDVAKGGSLQLYLWIHGGEYAGAWNSHSRRCRGPAGSSVRPVLF